VFSTATTFHPTISIARCHEFSFPQTLDFHSG